MASHKVKPLKTSRRDDLHPWLLIAVSKTGSISYKYHWVNYFNVWITQYLTINCGRHQYAYPTAAKIGPATICHPVNVMQHQVGSRSTQISKLISKMFSDLSTTAWDEFLNITKGLNLLQLSKLYHSGEESSGAI